MSSDPSFCSVYHPWDHGLPTTEPPSPYPTLSPYEDFASLRPTNRSPPPSQMYTPRPGTPRPDSLTSLPGYQQPSKSSPLPTPLPRRSHALGIDIPAISRLSPKPQFTRHMKHNNTPQTLLLPDPPFVQTQFSPLSAHSSPSLSSSVTTAPSSPDIPLCQPRSFHCQLSQAAEPIRTKRKFSTIRQPKRLPHHVEPPWEVHALIQVCETPDSRLGEQKRAAAAQSADRSVGHCESDKALLLPYEFERGHDQPWPGTFVHYRGASFEVINPQAALLSGRSLIETPAAEIELLIDDYLDQIDTMPSPSSSNDLTPSRQLYPGPEEARRAILGITRSDNLAVDGGLDGQAYGQAEGGESAINAILADYNHTTPTIAADREDDNNEPSAQTLSTTSESSDTRWLDFVRHAQTASPGLPFHAAIAKAHADTPTAARIGGFTDPATTDRTYGDTNRLLQLTPQSQVLPAAPGDHGCRTQPRLRRVTASVGTVVHNLVERLPSQALSSDEIESLPSSQAATFYNPFDVEAYEREDEIDAEADWETENLESDSDNLSLAAGLQQMCFNDFDYDYELDRAQDGNLGDAAAARDEDPATSHPISVASQQLSMIYNSRFASMNSGEHLPLTQHDDLQAAETSIDRIRREQPSAFQFAINDFLQTHGQRTAAELSRVWTRNNYGKKSRLSDSSFDHVIREARIEEDKVRLQTQPQAVVATHNHSVNRAGLQYSPTADTFATTRPHVHNTFIERLRQQRNAITPPQPIYHSDTDIADFGGNGQRAKRSRPGLRSMASISSQTGLRDLHLTSTPTSNIADAAGHNAPLGERAHMRPYRPDQIPQYGRARITPLDQQRWIELSSLDRRGHAVSVPTLHRRSTETVGRRILQRHYWNPIALLMMYSGAYDSVVSAETGGEHHAVAREVKIEAFKWAVLEMAIAVLVGSIIAFFVVIATLPRH